MEGTKEDRTGSDRHKKLAENVTLDCDCCVGVPHDGGWLIRLDGIVVEAANGVELEPRECRESCETVQELSRAEFCVSADHDQSRLPRVGTYRGVALRQELVEVVRDREKDVWHKTCTVAVQKLQRIVSFRSHDARQDTKTNLIAEGRCPSVGTVKTSDESSEALL